MNIESVQRICSENLVNFQLEDNHFEQAVSDHGLYLLERLGEGEGETQLDVLGCLQIAMSRDNRIPDVVKKQLLYGLLLPRGLTVIKEDGIVVAPSPEIIVSPLSEGNAVFLSRPPPSLLKDPPDIAFFCQWKEECKVSVHRIVFCILRNLHSIGVTDSFCQLFRLKSFSGVMNKLLYRGKGLTDLYACSVNTDHDLKYYRSELEKRGGIFYNEKEKCNSRGDPVYRYIRILHVFINAYDIYFPVYYEIVRSISFQPPLIPHDQYEFDRLQCNHSDGQKNMLERSGFTLLSPT